jgi:hypothetical protein
VQVDPFKPALKAPGTKRLKLIHDGPLSNFAFKLKLRRYTKDALDTLVLNAVDLPALDEYDQTVGRLGFTV